MDLSKLDYVSSAGLRVLLSAHKQMSQKGGMKVTHLNEIVQEVFNVTGFSDILTIE
jgi:anti-sigma B factor antagonist